jgi:Flp pilus assembly protein TadG
LHRFARPSGGDARKSSRESGQALLELALVAPVLILILAGLVQFALIFETQIGIDNAIREAARRGATASTPDVATAQTNANWTLTQVQGLLGNSQNHTASRDSIWVCFFTPTGSKAQDPQGNYQVDVRITDAYKHPLFMPIVDLFLDGIDGVTDQSLLATSTTEFHVEQTGSNNIGVGAGAQVDTFGNVTTGACT